MQMTMEDAVSYINQKLNYASVAYEDLTVFFDQAVSELNSMLNIALDPISKLATSQLDIFNMPNVLRLNQDQINAGIPVADGPSENISYYYNPSTSRFYVKDLFGNWKDYEVLYGVSNSMQSPQLYRSWVYTNGVAWYPSNENEVTTLNLTDYIAYDWMMLFIIPYVCHGWTARDGGNTLLFAEEFSQGYIQLRKSYGIPSKVRLSTVAHLPAYTKIVKEYMEKYSNWGDMEITTKAITEDMRIPDVVERKYDNVVHGNVRKGWF